MEIIFDTLIDSFLENNVGISKHFLPATLTAGLKANLLNLYSENKLRSAGTGNGTVAVQDKSVRGDLIFWLDRKNNHVAENAFFDILDAFIIYLNSTCYSGITGYEFHYTLYEPGTFYQKHVDRFRNNPSRQFSMIFYLNENWQQADGGELCIYHNEKVQKIAPENGKSVFFKSDQLLHEVLPATRPRMSITGWLKRS